MAAVSTDAGAHFIWFVR